MLSTLLIISACGGNAASESNRIPPGSIDADDVQGELFVRPADDASSDTAETELADASLDELSTEPNPDADGLAENSERGALSDPSSADDRTGREDEQIPLETSSIENSSTRLSPAPSKDASTAEESSEQKSPPRGNAVPTRAPKGSGPIEVSFRTLSDFKYEMGENSDSLPDKIRALEGRKITIEGFMLPIHLNDKGRVTDFALMPNLLLCCYGIPPELNEWIEVIAVPGKSFDPIADLPIRVTGTFSAKERVIDEVTVGLYRLKAESATSQ